jgi:hypothetical protein
MAVEVRWVHGNAFVPERIDDGRLARVEEPVGFFIPWTDRVGLPKGWGRIYRGQRGSENWFHAMVPTPQLEGGAAVRIQTAYVTFDSASAAEVQNFHVYDGPHFIFARDNIRITGNFATRIAIGSNAFDITNTPAVSWGVGVSIRVFFREEARITFHSAGARFLSP